VQAAALEAFTKAYIDGLTIKPRTRDNLHQCRRWLVQFFGADKPLREITQGDADDWRQWLATQGRQSAKLGKNTIRRHCGRARQLFTAAKKRKLVAENPFAEMKDTTVKANRERDYFVTRAEADKVLTACPNTQWKLLFALSRYGGLRSPSEPLALKWSDIDWAAGRFTVHSPKTEHHEGKATRVVPIFPELRPYLEAAKAAAKRGAEYVITIGNIRRDRYANQRSRMKRIIERAGLKPWPKLFHNLRASRETELAADHPMHVVCEWIGNTPKVAKEHYLRVTDVDFEYAQYAPEDARRAKNGMRQRRQPGLAQSCLLLQTVKKALENEGLEQVAATVGKAVQEFLIPRTGFEPVTPGLGNRCSIL